LQDTLYLGNLDAKRDWGHARDYAEGMWRILQLQEPDDFVLGTGEMHSVREFAELAFGEVGITIAWRGSGRDETGIDAATRRVLVKIDPRYVRPTEVDHLISDPSKARQKLGWQHTVSFKELVSEMVRADMKRVKMEARRRNRSE
jgi:GDPmannose 4,6-dehydratase